jgi:hypothetical protein
VYVGPRDGSDSDQVRDRSAPGSLSPFSISRRHTRLQGRRPKQFHPEAPTLKITAPTVVVTMETAAIEDEDRQLFFPEMETIDQDEAGKAA